MTECRATHNTMLHVLVLFTTCDAQVNEGFPVWGGVGCWESMVPVRVWL